MEACAVKDVKSRDVTSLKSLLRKRTLFLCSGLLHLFLLDFALQTVYVSFSWS